MDSNSVDSVESKESMESMESTDIHGTHGFFCSSDLTDAIMLHVGVDDFNLSSPCHGVGHIATAHRKPRQVHPKPKPKPMSESRAHQSHPAIMTCTKRSRGSAASAKILVSWAFACMLTCRYTVTQHSSATESVL